MTIGASEVRHVARLAELAVAYKGRGVLAFDLAGQEKDYPAKAHRAAFQLILKNNINSTVHAGEAFGPASIGQALHHCGAHRRQATRAHHPDQEPGQQVWQAGGARQPLPRCAAR
mgnify:CR=1 FL=1